MKNGDTRYSRIYVIKLILNVLDRRQELTY